MIIDELNKKIADIESLANDKTSTIESKVSDLTDGLLMVADAVDIIPEMVDEKITAITKEFSTIKDTVSKVKAQKGEKGAKGDKGDTGATGATGADGKDGSPDTPEQIAEKLNELEGVLDTKVLKDFNIPDVSNLQNQINTIGNQTLRLLSRPTSTNTNAPFTGVTTDATLTGVGTVDSPLKVVSTSASDVAVTVRAATTAALAGTWIYDNGTDGVGATLTRTTNGALPNQDGISLSEGDRFLIKNQVSTLVNGVYVLTQKGVASVSPTIFTRATDADSTSELDELVVTVSEGSTNRGTVWGQQTNNPVVGTSAIVFATVVSTAVTQATSGTQAIYQIPTLTGTARQITRGTANFKYNPTNDLFTIRGIDYTFPANNGDASQVLTTDGSGTLSWTTPSGGGTPAGSNNQIQINQSGSFFADNKFQKSDTGFNVGLNHTLQSAVTFTGSGLDDLTVSGTFSGTYPTTYTVTIDGINKDVLLVNTSSISGGSFAVGNTITNGLGASATIDAISVDSLDDKTIFVISSYTGTFNNGDTIDNGSGVTATQTGSVTTRDTFTWTDGTTTVTQTTVLDSNGVYAFLSSPTGHTLSDSWTWTYSYVNQNVLDFSNNDYKFQSTFGTDTFGYQISDNLLGFGITGSVNTWTTNGGDLGISGFADLGEGFGFNSLIQWTSGSVSTLILTEDNAKYEVNYLGSKSKLNLLPNEFDLTGTLSGLENGVSLKGDIVSLGNLSGGNNTKITIDDVNEQITISNLQAFDDDAAAGTGGLIAGMVYMTTGSGAAPLNAAGILMIKQ